MEIKIERMVMSGKGPKVLYKLTSNGQILFRKVKEDTNSSFWAWTKKKDAQAVIDAIETRGLESVEEELQCKAL
jgi:DNA-binding HxlR family transcriptional regulator